MFLVIYLSKKILTLKNNVGFVISALLIENGKTRRVKLSSKFRR